MKTYCENCGCAVYSGACVNCHEETYIAEQHIELGTFDECSDEFKKKVAEQAEEIAKNETPQTHNRVLCGESSRRFALFLI